MADPLATDVARLIQAHGYAEVLGQFVAYTGWHLAWQPPALQDRLAQAHNKLVDALTVYTNLAAYTNTEAPATHAVRDRAGDSARNG